MEGVTLKKIKDFINRRGTLLRLVFVLAVLIFVIGEAGKILKQVNGDKLQASLSSQSQLSLIIMAICGFAAVLPMLTYDFTIVKFLPGKFKIGYIVRSGWIVNSFTNLFGFGGLLGASLRAHFYSKNATKKQILYAISKVALFLLAGLSALCLISLIMIFGFRIGSMYAKYWIWLLGGALYFPAVLLVTHLNNSEFFSDLSLKKELAMGTGSFFEWLCALVFFIIIGMLMKINTNFASVIPIFVIANVAGVVSLIPGGLGSFDVFMILGLSYIGVSESTAIVWILFYRVFYYILPFLLGVILFIQDTGSKLNQRLDGLPRMLIERISQIILTVFMYFSGIIMLLLATLPNVVIFNKFYPIIAPYTFFYIGQITNIVVAFLLIGFASGIWAKTKRAFWPTVIVLIISIINTLINESFTWNMIIFLLIILVILGFSKKVLYRDKMSNSWGSLIFNGSIFVVTLIAYVIVGIVNSNNTGFKLNNAYVFPSQQIWISGLTGLAIALIVLILINRYLTHGKPSWMKEKLNTGRVRNIIENYGGNEISHLVFLRDKNVYYYTVDGEDQVFFMYRINADKLIIMGEPVGNKAYFNQAIDQFMEDADKQNMKLVFYEVNENLTMLLHEKGFDFIKAGETGLVDVDEFTLAGKRHRGERALMNKFDRDGYQFEIINPPFNSDFLLALKEISDEWLNGKTEKGFSLGYFDNNYLNEAPIAIMKDKDGAIVAFANLMPSGGTDTTSIDLMRSSDNAPSGIMDGIFVNLYQASKDKGYKYFDLGMSPLSNVGISKFSFPDEKMAHLIYQYGYKFYSFEGLRSYKDKYVDKWTAKYIAYQRSSSLVFTMMQILTVVNKRVGKNSKRILVPKIFEQYFDSNK